ncbi:hypothetical protein MTR67_008586 [Solanum verrucosum]|uniref:Reverse transcriptase Ty1/copia-type domain-containing protein n=1 Tax=Solanum verrucosum TaxID=315347 RepID=A0AAF0TDR7_SOLVR|nr:hypothetical protein MTR67_008586 [Solanum verrucosum]
MIIKGPHTLYSPRHKLCANSWEFNRVGVFVHVPKDERSKLDVKTRQCIFVGYDQDEFGYRFFDPVEKKLVKSCDVVFFEDQTIEDLDKAEKVDSQNSKSLVDVDPVPLTIPPGENLQINIKDGDHTQNDMYAIDAQVQNDVVGQQPTIIDAIESSLKRSTKEKIFLSRYSPNEYVLLTDGGEPESLDEAMESEEKEMWIDVMEDEMKSLHDNYTFDLVILPKDRKTLKSMWIFQAKHEDGNLITRYKAILVVKGFNQKKGIDFDEIFSPVVKMSSICVVLGLAATKRIGNVAYELELPQELAVVHPVFHISMLKKCIGDPSLILPTESVRIKDNLSYEEIPVQILERQVRRLRTNDVASVKVLWRNQFIEEATWEAEKDMKKRYSYLFKSGGNVDQVFLYSAFVLNCLILKEVSQVELSQIQVHRISILHVVDPAEQFRVSGQGFAWGQQWSSSAGPALGVGSGRDKMDVKTAFLHDDLDE